ncbi:MAG TPA: acyl-CoA dehydrogenase family protein [Solirubrobacterales bacterium]
MTPQAAIPLPETFDEAGFDDLKAEIAAYVANEGEEWTRRIEAERAVPPELRVELKERGYLSLAGPAEYGGAGIPFSRYLELLELFAMSHASLRMIVHVANGVWRSVDQFATEEQRRDYVMPAVTGDLTVAFTLTEPTAGTGADLRCEVEREGDTYYLSGEKHLITFGVSCDRWLLFARLAGTKGAEGTIALLVDRETPNVKVEDMGESLGVRGTDHAHLVFDRAPVPVSDTLGEEGKGLQVAFGGFLTPSRIAVAMTCVGLARRAQELAAEFAAKRVTFGKPLSQRQAISFALAENAADIEAARQLTLHAARRWEAGAADASVLSSMAKLTAVDMLTRVTDKALQAHGGVGFWASSPIERVYRDARAQRFEEGTNEIQKTIIAREVFAPVHATIAEREVG